MNFPQQKILYLITDLNIGGTEKMLYELTTRIDRNMFNPIVCGLKSHGYYAEKIKNRGISLITLNVDKGISLLKNIRAIFILIKIIRKEKIKLLHTFLFRANFIGRIAGRLAGVTKVISSVRVMEKEKTYHLYFERITSFLSDKFIVNSATLKSFVSEKMKINPERIETIYNGIDFLNLPKVENRIKRQELGYRENDVLIGTAGRLHKQKGLIYFLQAVKILTQSLDYPIVQSLRFLIIGDGPERKNLQSEISNLQLENRVQLLGWRTDAQEIISILNIFALSSLWEGTPNVVLEALAYARPVVATEVGGVPEIIENGVQGLLVEPANVQTLAEAIIRLLKNREEAKEMGEKGREKVEKYFTIDKMVRDTEKIYNQLL